MERIYVQFTNKKSMIIECDNYHNVSKKWVFLKNNKIIYEFLDIEVTGVEKFSSLPFGKIIPKNKT